MIQIDRRALLFGIGMCTWPCFLSNAYSEGLVSFRDISINELVATVSDPRRLVAALTGVEIIIFLFWKKKIGSGTTSNQDTEFLSKSLAEFRDISSALYAATANSARENGIPGKIIRSLRTHKFVVEKKNYTEYLNTHVKRDLERWLQYILGEDEMLTGRLVVDFYQISLLLKAVNPSFKDWWCHCYALDLLCSR